MLIIRVSSNDVAVENCKHGTDSMGKVMERLAWFNYRRLFGPIGYIPPADAEAECYRQLANRLKYQTDLNKKASTNPGRFIAPRNYSITLTSRARKS